MVMVSSFIQASGTQVFLKELTGSSRRNVGEVITCELKSSCNSLTGDCGSLTILDELPLGMVISSCIKPVGFTVNQCTPGTTTVEIHLLFE